MHDAHHRQCLHRLLSLCAQAESLPERQVAAEVDHMLSCDERCACLSRLTCSCLACELATLLSRRYR